MAEPKRAVLGDHRLPMYLLTMGGDGRGDYLCCLMRSRRSFGGVGFSAGLVVMCDQSLVVVCLVSPPVARKKPFGFGPASTLVDGVLSAVKRALVSGVQSLPCGFAQPFV